MKIAIVGSGIAGNVAAYSLHAEHDVTVFEAGSHVGGHTHTHQIAWQGNTYSVDTGFIVFNKKTYPRFTRLLEELDVEIKPTTMSFSVKCEQTGLEYNGTGLNTLFAQRRNLFNLSFYRMLREIVRFNREAAVFIEAQNESTTLGEFLRDGAYGQEFVERYLVPMGAAIWSADPERMYGFPARFFIRFLHNHGLLTVTGHPQWYVISGGSDQSVEKLTAPFCDQILTQAPVERIIRYPDRVEVEVKGQKSRIFDQVILATHSDQALSLLADPSALEQEVLGAIPYQSNEAVLHTDSSVLPRVKRAWAAWNYHLLNEKSGHVPVTYNMNLLQGITAPVEFCVTLNNGTAIDPEKVIKRITYQHPVFTPESVHAQQKQRDINGVNRTYFCGAYWGNGFHEDGVVSALNAIDHFRERTHGELSLRRAG